MLRFEAFDALRIERAISDGSPVFRKYQSPPTLINKRIEQSFIRKTSETQSTPTQD